MAKHVSVQLSVNFEEKLSVIMEGGDPPQYAATEYILDNFCPVSHLAFWEEDGREGGCGTASESIGGSGLSGPFQLGFRAGVGQKWHCTYL